MGIAQNLKALRHKKRISQKSLAELSGVSQQLISQIENEKNTSTKLLPALARALACSVSDIDPAYGEMNAEDSLTEFLELYRVAKSEKQKLAIDLAIVALKAP